MTTSITAEKTGETDAPRIGVTVNSHELKEAIDVAVEFAGDIDNLFGRQHDDVDEADYIMVDFTDGRVVFDAGTSDAWATAFAAADAGFSHEPILVARGDLKAVSRFIGRTAGDVVTDVTVDVERDGYLRFRVGNRFEATVAYEPTEEPYFPARRTPALVAAGAGLAVAAYLAIRAITRHRTQ